MDAVIHAWQGIPHSFWVALGASGVISIVLQFIKHYLEELSPKVLMVLLTTFSFAAAAINYLLANAAANPHVLGSQTAMLVGMATIVYRFAVAPGYKLLTDAKNFRAAADAAKAAPTTTVTGTSTSPTTPTVVSVTTPAAPAAPTTGEASF